MPTDPIYWISSLWDWSPIIANTLAIISLCFVYLKIWPGYSKIINIPYPFTVIPILLLLFVAFPVLLFHDFMVFRAKVPLGSDCQLSPKSVAMPSSGVIFALVVQPDPAFSRGSLVRFTGPVGNETPVTAGQNIFAYKCDVVNYGSAHIFNVEMAMHIKYMELVNGTTSELDKPKFIVDWPISIPEIGAGNKFSFYISNNSKYMIAATLPATVQYKRSNGDIMVAELKQPILQMLFPPSL